MKNTSQILAVVALVLGGISTSLAGTSYYVRSNVGAPWGVNSNENAMDRAFGSGSWTQDFFETANPGTLFSPATSFIFLEGSDSNANELEAFLGANGPALEAWVNAGGNLLLNAAPNEGNGMSYGFGGVNLVYPDFDGAGVATAVNPGHPIFNGPFTPVGTAYTGSFFSHASLTGAFSPILVDGNGSPVLAEQAYGSGLALFGGLTTDNWHGPNPDSANLTANVIAYASRGIGSVPDAGTNVLTTGVALASLVLLRRSFATKAA